MKKKCTKCKEYKCMKLFALDRNIKSGRRGYCKKCANIYFKKKRSNGVYSSYRAAKERCTNKNNIGYYVYGGRGIKFLFNSWKELKQELGNRPGGMTLDRIDTNGNYESGNVKWSTRVQQARNKRNNRFKEKDILMIRKLYKLGSSISHIALKFNCKLSSISTIVHNRYWKGVSDE